MKINPLLTLFLFYSSAIFSQIEEAPTAYSKIYFTYTKKSNYYVDEKGIYADTLLLKLDFPEKTFFKRTFPKDSTIIAGFIPINFLTDTDRITLNSIAQKNYSRTEVVFDVKEKKSTITKILTDNSLIPTALFALLTKTPFQSKPSTSDITYKENFRYLVENKAENTLDSYEKNVIKWIEGYENVGLFEYKMNGQIMTNLVFVDPKLNKHIVPTILFANCEFGISKVVSIPFTVELIKVSYK